MLSTCLVGGLEHDFYFPINLGKFIIPIDEFIFFRGVAQPPTRYNDWPHIGQLSPVESENDMRPVVMFQVSTEATPES